MVRDMTVREINAPVLHGRSKKSSWTCFFDKHVGIVAALSFLVYFTIDTLARTLTFVAARGHREPGEAA